LNLINQIQNGKFLPTGCSDGPNILNFYRTDSELIYQENLKNQPLDWYYRNNPISYQINSDGYRSQEFDSIDWANSVIIFGCSNVFGLGLHEKDTLSYRLSSLIDKPVINMGINGSGMEVALLNSVILNKHYPSPLAVIQIWSHHLRTSYYQANEIHHYRLLDKKNWYTKAYYENFIHGETRAIMTQMISQIIWENKTKYYEASFFPDTAILLKIPHIICIDEARDTGPGNVAHPGRNSIKTLAVNIKNMLKL